MKYGIYHTIFQYCKKHPNALDYTKEDSGLYTIPYAQSPKNNIGVILKKKFKIDVEIMPDGAAHLFVNMKCSFESTKTIWDLICQGENVINMDVECDWQSYQSTYQLKKVYDTPVSQPVNGFRLTDYWNDTAPWHLNGINLKQYAVSVYDSKEDRNGLYIPQSLRPIVTRAYIAQHDKQLSSKIDKYTKLSMGKRLQTIQDFLSVLNAEKDVIDTNPVPIEELGYHRFNCTQNLPNLLIAQGRKITLQKKYDVFRYGFYKLPDKPIIAAFMDYKPEREKSLAVVKSINDFCKKGIINDKNNNSVMPDLLPLFFKQVFPYQKGDSLSYEMTANKIKKDSQINFAIVALPIDKDEEAYYEESVSPHDIFKKVFAHLKLPSQMVSIEMTKTIGTDNVLFYLQNLALGILSKSGGVPWILEKPMDGVDCFIGLDVGTQQKGIHYPACSVCLGAQGNLIKYYTTPAVQQGEKINASTLEDIFNKILIAYQDNNNGRLPEHIVIHRDGFSNENMDWYIHYFESKHIRFDLVEVKKFVSRRLLDNARQNFDCNPASGIAAIKGNEAYLITTEVKPYLGSPQPIHLVHRHGALPMENIVKQIYVLSEMHTGSMRTSRLPLTTLYADKICKNHDYVPINQLLSELYFL